MTTTTRQLIVGAVFTVLLGLLVLGTCERRPEARGDTPAQSVSTQQRAAQEPQDVFQRCAREALSGRWGKLQPWQEEAYRMGLRRGTRIAGRVFLTAYYPWEGRSGRVDSAGAPCTKRTAAANRIPREIGRASWWERV